MNGSMVTPDARRRGEVSPRLVDDAMLRHPKTWPTTLTTAQARRLLADDHLHAVLLVDGPKLLGVVVATDLDDVAGGDEEGQAALDRSRLAGRTALSGTLLRVAERDLEQSVSRRLAVVDHAGDLVGLLCLKRRRDGYCTDEGVAARRPSPAAPTGRPGALGEEAAAARSVVAARPV